MSEDLELLRLRAKAKAKAEREREQSVSIEPVQEQEQGPVMQETVTPSGRVVKHEEITHDDIKATGYGVVEGIPFAKDVLAGGEALLEGGDFGEQYNENLAEWNDAINKAEEEHPIAFTVGDIGSGFAIPAAKGLKGAIALGSTSALSRSEDRDFWDVFSGAAIGGGAYGVVRGASSLIDAGRQKLGSALGVLADETTKDAMGAVSVANRKVVNTHVQKYFNKGGKKSDIEATADFADYIMNKQNKGKPIISEEMTPDAVSRSFRDWKTSVNDKMDKALSKVDRVLDDAEVYKVYKAHKASLALDEMAKAGPEAAAKAERMLTKLKSEYFNEELVDYTHMTVKKYVGLDKHGKAIYEDAIEKVANGQPKLRKMTVKDLQAKKRFYGETAHNAFDKQSNTYKIEDVDFYKKGNGVLGSEIDEVISRELKDDAQAGVFKELNKEWATANMGEQLARETANKQGQGFMHMIKEGFAMRNILLAGGAVAGSGAKAQLAGGALLAINAARNKPNINAQMAVNLRRLSQELSENVNSEYMQRLSVAASLSNDAFRNAISSSFSELSLKDKPINREIISVIERKDEILNVLSYHSPELANQFREAVKNGSEDLIGELMSKVEQVPGAQRFIEEGVGYGGKVYNEADKATFEQQIKSSNAPAVQKQQLLRDLRSGGIIPQLDQIQPRQRRQYVPRNKKETRDY